MSDWLDQASSRSLYDVEGFSPIRSSLFFGCDSCVEKGILSKFKFNECLYDVNVLGDQHS